MPGAPQVEPWTVADLATALAVRGCPEDRAREIAASVRFAYRAGWLALLDGPLQTHGVEVPVRVTPDDRDGAVRHLTDDVSGENAQAVDRTARGEQGWTPAWEVDRRAR